MGTGSPSQDAQHDFSRARRARLLADVARRMRASRTTSPSSSRSRRSSTRWGASARSTAASRSSARRIVGTVDRAADFDRGFRPTTTRLRSRWERIAAAQRRGEALPPVSLFQVGDLYFVRDGHHRVSVAKSLGRDDIDAYVTEVTTRLRLGHDLRVSELPLKDHERLFRERVPLTAEQRKRIPLSDPWDFGWLAEMVEAWGFRMMQERGHFADRHEVAQRWFEQEYVPVSEMLDEGGLTEREETETDAYMRLAGQRYLLLRTHEWSDEVVDRLRRRATSKRRRLPAPAAPTCVTDGRPRVADWYANSSPSRSARPPVPPPRTSSTPSGRSAERRATGRVECRLRGLARRRTTPPAP